MLRHVQRGSPEDREALCRPFVEVMARCLQGSLMVDSGHPELVEVWLRGSLCLCLLLHSSTLQRSYSIHTAHTRTHTHSLFVFAVLLPSTL